MNKTITTMFVLTWMLVVPNARGQSIGPSTINASGGSGTIGATKFDWSIGEMTMVSTFTGSSVIVTQGVLQNNKSASGVPSVTMGDNLQVFPNPASTLVNLKYTAATAGTLSYHLLDITGKMIIKNNTVISQGITQEQLNISELAAATYMLEVSFKSVDGAEAVTSYKIEKLK